MLRVALAALAFAAIILAWMAARLVIPSPDVFLPAPDAVVRSLIDMFVNDGFAEDILASVWRVSAGFLLAIVVGYPLGVAIGTSKIWEGLIQPLNDFARYLPVAALVPLVIVWFGITDVQKIVVIFLGCVFQFVPMVADTTRRVPRELVELGRSLGMRKQTLIQRVIIPATAPEIYDHSRIVLGWAWSYVVVAEVVAASSGVGHVIVQAQRFIKTDEVLAGVLTIGVIGVVFDQLFRMPKRYLFRWSQS